MITTVVIPASLLFFKKYPLSSLEDEDLWMCIENSKFQNSKSEQVNASQYMKNKQSW